MRIRTFILIILLLFFFGYKQVVGQSKTVTKTNSKPVYMHYMPWFDTPETSGSNEWGWHWKMNSKNPNKIVDPLTGKREIASHFYPLIGPYASNDPIVLEYHLLLMKYAGIDGVLIDWYGVKGSNKDIDNLLRNSNAILDHADKIGLSYGVVLEDRFSSSIEDVKANLAYLSHNYFSRAGYIRVAGTNDPLMNVFGPINFQQPHEWEQILAAANEEIEFLTLWNESKDGGIHADGEYAWIWEDESLDNYFSHLQNYYSITAPKLKTVMGVAFPGFVDFYKEGGAGEGYFNIPHEKGATLDKTFDLIKQHDATIDMVQLATWNDFGEGTILEPTYETGFEYLKKIQKYTGVQYGTSELLLIYKLCELRKANKGNVVKNELLDLASLHLVHLEVTEAKKILDSFELNTNTLPDESQNITIQVYPNPLLNKEFKVTVSTKGKQPYRAEKISVSDLMGKVIYQQKITGSKSDFIIGTDKFKKGVYLVTLHLSKTVITTRVIISD